MKLGVVIPYSEDRGEQADDVLRNLNYDGILARKYKAEGVDAYLFRPQEVAGGNTVTCCLVEGLSKPFNKSMCLNYGAEILLGTGADILSIVDVDMIYSESFIPTIVDYYDGGVITVAVYDYIISNGYYLTKEGTQKCYAFNNEEIIENIDCFVSKEEQMNTKMRVYASQVTLTKEAIELIFKTLNTNKLFDERFVGWGREDALLRDTLTELIKYGALRRKYLDNMWFHMYHEKGIKNEANETLYQSEKVIMKQKVSEYYGKR